MKMKKKHARFARLLTVVLMLCMVGTLFAACSSNDETQGGGGEQNGGEEPSGEEKVYRTYMSSDVTTLDAHNNVQTNVQTPLSYTNATLWLQVPDEDGMNYHYIGDLAEDLPEQIDDYTWQFKIRQEAKWHNGDPINADTLIYSWKMLIDPTLVNSMANFMWYYIDIKNAETYFNGECDWEDVGIKKIDDYTIQLITETPATENDVCANFIDRSLYPVNEELYEAGMNDDRTETSYGIDLDSYMGCGPYFFDTWTRDSVEVYKKNPDYWNADLYHYDTVEIYIIPEKNAQVQMFEQGKLDELSLDSTTIDTYIDDPRLAVYPSTEVDHIDINCKNTENPLSANVNYRRAMYYAIDRETIAEEFFGHQKPAGFYISEQAGIFSEDGVPWRETAQGKEVTDLIESWGPNGYSPELAREYLAKAYEECGLAEDTVVPVIFLYNADNAAWRATSEYLDEQFPEIFEGKIDLQIVTYSGISNAEYKAGNDTGWDLNPDCWSRSLSRYNPYTAFYYYLSSYDGGPNNYYSERFEEQYAKCEAATSYEEELNETEELEKIYLEDVVNIPVVQDVYYTLFSDRVVKPMKQYVPGFGWGTAFGDIAE